MLARFTGKMRPVTDDYGVEHMLWHGTVANSGKTPTFRKVRRGPFLGARKLWYSHLHGVEVDALKVSCGVNLCMTHLYPRPQRDPHIRRLAIKRRAEWMRGIPSPMAHTSRQPAHEWARRLVVADGMTAQEISAASGVPLAAVRNLVRYGEQEGQHQVTLATEEAILGVAVPVGHRKELAFGSQIDSTGSHRRMEALMAGGFHSVYLSQELGGLKGRGDLARNMVSGTSGSGRRVYSGHAERIRQLFERLADTAPAEVGILHYESVRIEKFARQRGFAPRHCWDDDTIDDPGAIPEWTGHCGSTAGYDIHIRERHEFLVPAAEKGKFDTVHACNPCRAAAKQTRWPVL